MTKTQIPESKLRFGLYYIVKEPYGYVEVLEAIHNDLPVYLKESGYISYGLAANGDLRYRTTDEGIERASTIYTAMLLTASV